MGLFNSDLADVSSQLRELSYQLRTLSINVDYLFANQRHLIEYLASMDKIEVTYRNKEIMRELESLREIVRDRA